jgi:hypothetical protein
MNPFDPFGFSSVFGSSFGAAAPRPTAPPEPVAVKRGITVQDLVDRGTSIVRLGDKTYRITAKEVEVTR